MASYSWYVVVGVVGVSLVKYLLPRVYHKHIYKPVVRMLTGKCEVERACFLSNACSGHMLALVTASLHASTSLAEPIQQHLDALVQESKEKGSSDDEKQQQQQQHKRTTNHASAIFALIDRQKSLSASGSMRTNLFECCRELCRVRVFTHVYLPSLVVSYDKTNPAHEQLLNKLWVLMCSDTALDARVSSMWGTLGFQGKDPATDFRGMGLLGLQQLVTFAEHYPKFARSIQQEADLNGTTWFSYAITGINLTNDILKLAREGKIDRFFYYHGASDYAFNLLYAICFVQFNRMWRTARPPNVMSFGPLHTRFLAQFERDINCGKYDNATKALEIR